MLRKLIIPQTIKLLYPKGRLLPSELKLRDFVIWKEPVLKGFDQFFWKEAEVLKQIDCFMNASLILYMM